MTMRIRNTKLWLVGVSVILIGAAAKTAPDELLRQGNAAYARGDFTAALDFYSKAEAHSTDPGLLAFDKAATLYRLGNFRAAELLYRCSLTDAPEPRRTQLLFGLANSLVQQAQGRDAKMLQEAIGLYEQCVTHAEDAGLAEDARHNLELAKLLRIEALTSPNKPADDNPPGNDPDPKPPNPKDHTPPDSNPNKGTGKPNSTGDHIPANPDPKNSAETTDPEPSPGDGNLPPISDTDPPTPKPPEAAAADIQEKSARILNELSKHKQARLKQPTPGVKDW
jgi:tetratricopeptide (TPR) repeat protein